MRYSIDEDNIVWREINKEVMIYDLRSGRYYALNKTGMVVWTMLAGHKGPEEIMRKISSRYGISMARVRTDVSAIIESLKAEKLIRVASARP